MSTLPSQDATWPTQATTAKAAAIADPKQIIRAGLLGGSCRRCHYLDL
jgi:hypothetical protein